MKSNHSFYLRNSFTLIRGLALKFGTTTFPEKGSSEEAEYTSKYQNMIYR